MPAGGQRASQVLWSMHEGGESAGAGLLAEAARIFKVTPNLLAASLDTLQDTRSLAPATSQLPGVMDGVMDVIDSVLDSLETLPMGVGSALNLIKTVLRRVQGVQINKRACGQLHSLVEGVGGTLARYVLRASKQQLKELEGPLAALTEVCA